MSWFELSPDPFLPKIFSLTWNLQIFKAKNILIVPQRHPWLLIWFFLAVSNNSHGSDSRLKWSGFKILTHIRYSLWNSDFPPFLPIEVTDCDLRGVFEPTVFRQAIGQFLTSNTLWALLLVFVMHLASSNCLYVFG